MLRKIVFGQEDTPMPHGGFPPIFQDWISLFVIDAQPGGASIQKEREREDKNFLSPVEHFWPIWLICF